MKLKIILFLLALCGVPSRAAFLNYERNCGPFTLAFSNGELFVDQVSFGHPKEYDSMRHVFVYYNDKQDQSILVNDFSRKDGPYIQIFRGKVPPSLPLSKKIPCSSRHYLKPK